MRRHLARGKQKIQSHKALELSRRCDDKPAVYDKYTREKACVRESIEQLQFIKVCGTTENIFFELSGFA